jgi:hypothetical protein
MALEFVYETAPSQIRSEPIPQLTRLIWPLQLPLSIKIAVAALALVAFQFHRWSKLSSGSVFSPEFPRPVVVLFNWAFGAIVLLALLREALERWAEHVATPRVSRRIPGRRRAVSRRCAVPGPTAGLDRVRYGDPRRRLAVPQRYGSPDR